jgi:hypothetical protein
MGKVEDAEDAQARLEHVAAVDAARHVRATERLARPATVGIYSASARLAYDALERRARSGAPLAVIAPVGGDPVPYVARAHLAGARAAGPLVLVEGTAARDHDLARWSDPVRSPLALADGGMLVLLDGHALPIDVQRLVAQAVAEKRVPWERAEPLDVVLALTAVGELPLPDTLDAALASRLSDALANAVRLPRLSERAEDVRAILTDRLAREGLRMLGSPVGIDDGAFARLVEYPFPGDEAELGILVQRLVARCAGPVAIVRAADVDALGIQGTIQGARDTGGPADPPDRKIRLV